MAYQLDSDSHLMIKKLGIQDYQITWQAMQRFTQQRQDDTPDEIWLVQHPAVYTLGINNQSPVLTNPKNIPVIQTDRGGQMTYHGLGQLIIYPLINLKQRKLGIKSLVTLLEQTVIDFLASYNINANTKPKAPGVYIKQKKIASLGLRLKRLCSYHGLSININMDLQPFTWIKPCGYQGLEMTQLADFGVVIEWQEIEDRVLQCLLSNILTGHNY